YLFPCPTFSRKPHLPHLRGNHQSPLRWVRCSDVEADQLQQGFEKVGRVLIPGVPQSCEITCLPAGGSAPHHAMACAVKELNHAIPAFKAAAVVVPFKHFFMIHGPSLQFVQPDRKIRESLPGISSPTIKDHLARAMRGDTVG